MRLAFFGSGAFGLPTLQQLAPIHDVTLVITQPNRPAGRKRRLTPTPIAAFAADHGLPTIKPERPNEPEVIQRIRRAGAEAFVVIAYGHKLGENLLESAFAINLHGSLLPKYRGAAPINWAMINGETTTGLSVITLAQRMDAGAVLAQSSTRIDPMETAGELHDRLAEMGPELVLETLQKQAAGTLTPVEQDEATACSAPKLSKADGTVDFSRSAREVRCRVHGLTPWPGCTARLGGKTLRIVRVQEIDASDAGPPGTVLADGAVACGRGAVRLRSVQPPGGKMMTFQAYCHGHHVQEGAILQSP